MASTALKTDIGVTQVNEPVVEQVKIEVQKLDFFYGTHHALFDISLKLPERRVTDLIVGAKLKGKITIDGENIYAPSVDVVDLRKRVGMVFQRSNPFPKSIFENVAFGPRIHGVSDKSKLYEIVERSLIRADLWREVKDRLHKSAIDLSGGQQQRLCIARALAVDPDILLMDEPASALDPRSTAKIEDLIGELRSQYTIVIVTHNMQQAARVSDYTAFFYEGKLVEYGATKALFTKPQEKQTEDYVTGRFG